MQQLHHTGYDYSMSSSTSILNCSSSMSKCCLSSSSSCYQSELPSDAGQLETSALRSPEYCTEAHTQFTLCKDNAGSFRGILLLDDYEYNELLKVLNNNEQFRTSWRFEIVDERNNTNIKKNIKKSSKKIIKNTSGENSLPENKESLEDETESHHSTLTSFNQSVSGESQHISNDLPAHHAISSNTFPSSYSAALCSSEFSDVSHSGSYAASNSLYPEQSIEHSKSSKFCRPIFNASSVKSTYDPLACTYDNMNKEEIMRMIEESLFNRAPPPPSILEKMNDWQRKIHRILFELCSFKASSPFLSNILFTDKNNKAFLDLLLSTSSKESPISFTSILDKLEHCKYVKVNDVLRDVYGILTCGFCLSEPHSSIWMSTHECSVLFERLLNAEIFCNTSVFYKNGNITCSPAGKSLKKKKQGNNNKHSNNSNNKSLDDMLKHIVINRRGKKKSRNLKRNKNKANRSMTKSYLTKMSKSKKKSSRISKTNSGSVNRSSKYKVITDEEREEFQHLLVNLSQLHHFELFNRFKKKAVWRTLDGGEVELDDRGTSALAFREMLKWCKRQTLQSSG